MNLNRRTIIALVGVTASLALPVAAMAHSATNASSSTTSTTSTPSRADHPRINFAAIATELKLTTEQVQTAFRDNRPPKTGTRPTQAQRDAAITATAAALSVDVATLKSLVNEYGGGAAAKGAKAAAIATQLGLSTAVVTKAIDDAHVTNPKPQGRPTEAQRNAFETAVAANLGLSKDTVSAAFAAVKAAHQAAKAS
ncbi:MAG: hypothetical protein JHD05_01700 [Thermoleophilia bacterium]|jgi:hypothetical protein|nr:hypothetical protein [Thermoleophilia bacterium]MBJ7333324.1 hypothetical protein [Thermoleophilia bacterium]